jgi:hypothetical protein
MIVDQSYDPEVTVQNLGSTQQTFDVNLSIKDEGDEEVYNQTVTGVTLDFLEIYQVTFSSFTPLDAVDYTLTAVAVNPGDEQADDDTSAVVVTAYQHQAGGGPDDFGYVFLDNTAQEGPEFSWIDISQTGIQIEPGDHYFMSDGLPIGFTFEFYGSPYDTMWVNSHGALHLGARDVWLMTNDCPLPDTSSPHVPMILPYWDRLEIRYEDNQGVYYQYFDEPENDYTVVQWQGTPFAGIGNMVEFEVIMYEDGNFLYQYNSVAEGLSNGQGQEATIGIENEFLPAGLTYLCNDDNVANRVDSGLVILWQLGETGYAYYPGDANMYNGAWPPAVIGGDVTYLVNYFRGLSSNPACLLGDFFCSGDANGDCQVIGSDVTRMVSYFRGLSPINYCPNYEPAWLTPEDLPVEAPGNWPGCE